MDPLIQKIAPSRAAARAETSSNRSLAHQTPPLLQIKYKSNMARAPSRRQLTGRRRRRAIRDVNSKARWMHLYHIEVSLRQNIQRTWIRNTLLAQQCLLFLLQLIAIKLLILNAPGANTVADATVDILIQLTNVDCQGYRSLARELFLLDHKIYDITPGEEALALQFKQPNNIRFASWDDQYCLNYTSYRKDDLLRIYNLFGLANAADNDGCIRVSTGCTNSRGRECCYRINSEELFLFFMTRFKKGYAILDIVNDTFGGDANKWSYAWGWMLRYLDNRYESIIGHQGLLRFRNDFPRFFEAIQREVTKPKWHQKVDDGRWWWSPGLSYCPYRIFGFVDCSIYRINVPFSGPFGDYKGASRKPLYDIMKRAFFTGFTHVHGVKVETVYLPNGISTVFGPVSCRRRDISLTGGASVHGMSGLNRFLSCIQRNVYPEPYAVLGDGIYGLNFDCIRSYYRAHFRRNEMNEYMRICDAEMTACRQSIEWDYGKKSRVFRICRDPDQYRLGKQNPVSGALLSYDVSRFNVIVILITTTFHFP